MPQSVKWFDRVFTLRPEAGMFPVLVERLRGTPARVEEKARTTPRDLLTRRLDGSWSIQENIGHLLDLEDLWAGRIDDFLEGRRELRPADLSNRTTHEANHNAGPIEPIVEAFRARRLELVARLDGLDEDLITRSAHHPRLDQPMRVIDLCLFIAEHDDHHLARITEIGRSL
jgi:uncharacterized damage-inducible protein DinB